MERMASLRTPLGFIPRPRAPKQARKKFIVPYKALGTLLLILVAGFLLHCRSSSLRI